MDAKPKIALNNHWFAPQDFTNSPNAGMMALTETAWGCLIYGFCSAGKFDIYLDESTKLDNERAYSDAVSLALGIYTIQVPHLDNCLRLICYCKKH